MPNFTIEGRRRQADIQRNWLWELVFPRLPSLAEGVLGGDIGEELTLQCRSISIPGRTIENVETYFLGQKQIFPGRQTFSNQVEAVFEGTEDQRIFRFFNIWMETIHNIDAYSTFGTAGVGSYLTKRDIAVPMHLRMYKYNGSLLSRKVHFLNVFPSAMADVAMSYEGNEAVKYSVTFSYDLWRLSTM
jgi:hypothetical protein